MDGDLSPSAGWNGQTLHQAALYDNYCLLNDLLEGSEKNYINARDICGRTPVYTAVSNGSFQCLTVLLQHGANPNIAANERCQNRTPLHQAVMDSKIEAIDLLLSHDAHLMALDGSGLTPLAMAKVIGRKEIINIMHHGAERVTQKIKKYTTDLCKFCEMGNLEKAKAVIEKAGMLKASVIKGSDDGSLIPLLSACKSHNKDLVEWLIESKADFVSHPHTNETPLHIACSMGCTDIVGLLVEKYRDAMLVKTYDGQLPFHYTARFGHLETLKILLRYGYSDLKPGHFGKLFNKHINKEALFDINELDLKGNSALLLACEGRHHQIVYYLLHLHVPRTPRPSETESVSELQRQNSSSSSVFQDSSASNTTPRHSAQGSDANSQVFGSRRDTDILYSRLESDLENVDLTPDDRCNCLVNVNVKNESGYTPLYIAVRNSEFKTVKFLIEFGAKVNHSVVDEGLCMTPLLSACQNGNYEMMDLLLSHGAEDEENKSFASCIISHDSRGIGLLLKQKTVADTVYTINKLLMLSEFSTRYETMSINSLDPRYLELCPQTPVSIKWNNLINLERIDSSWLNMSVSRLNPNVKPTSEFLVYGITQINISGNDFRKLPCILFRLPSLTCLNASYNRIGTFEIDDDVMNTSLIEVNLSCNKLINIPSSLFTKFLSLQTLNLSKNIISELPVEMWWLKSLTNLNLSENRLDSLPCTDIRLSQIEDTDPNQDYKEPEESIIYMRSLKEAHTFADNICTNDVSSIKCWNQYGLSVDPHHVSLKQNSTGLKTLDISRNNFVEVPQCLACCCENLESLVASENKLQSVGNISCYPAALKFLNLCKNQIDNVSSWLGGGSFSKDSSETPIQSRCYGNMIPTDSSFTSLARVSNTSSSRSSPRERGISTGSSSSSLSCLCCPHQLHMKLENLETLNLSFNHMKEFVLSRKKRTEFERSDQFSGSSLGLTSLADEAQTRLLFPNMKNLDVSSNKLRNIPPEIGDQTKLVEMDLSKNLYLKELAPELGLLKNLRNLNLKHCPINGPILDMAESRTNRTRDIVGFLNSIREEATVYNCMNMMFVGSHNIGKTSLLKRLRKEGKLPPKSKSPTHWNDRVQGTSNQYADGLSTVGIDINDLVIDRRENGPVHFRTWDFGGQKEYYATHQYFLSPRSLFLVMWRLIDGEMGVYGLLQWLVNIQARAPGSAVIIVGTYLDVLKAKATRKTFPKDFEDSMRELINNLYIRIAEHEKCGLPKVIGNIFVSCRTGENIRVLVNVIYDNVFRLEHPRSRSQNLLGQKIPKKYLILQSIVAEIAEERKQENKDPVVLKEKYLLMAMHKMSEKYAHTFRDVEELEQATTFLHEHGVIFHFEDFALKDLYFLDPQWLCDQLARVVTIRSINGFCSNGLMEVSKIRHLFRSLGAVAQQEDIESYIVSLLSKFEVALQFDSRNLLLPSLLPPAKDDEYPDVKIPLRKPKEDGVLVNNQRRVPSQSSVFQTGRSTFFTGAATNFESSNHRKNSWILHHLKTESHFNIVFSHCRLYLLTHFPSGFWPRLITRILADTSIFDVALKLFPLSDDIFERCPELKTEFQPNPEWQCWQTGLELHLFGQPVLRIQESIKDGHIDLCNFYTGDMKIYIDGQWKDVEAKMTSILEIYFPTDLLTFHFSTETEALLKVDDPKQKVSTQRNQQATASLLAKTVEYIDNLLHDWYPEIGAERFAQNCFGRYLITRAIPCCLCLHHQIVQKKENTDDNSSWEKVNKNGTMTCPVRINDERESMPSEPIYSFLVEQCMLKVLQGKHISCPAHGIVSPRIIQGLSGIWSDTYHIAPDVTFQDIDRSILLNSNDVILKDQCLGEGTFGKVYAGTIATQNERPVAVAVKVVYRCLSKIEASALDSEIIMSHASTAYLSTRQELSLLMRLKHQHIVPLRGLTLSPLQLLLSPAPMGSLDTVLIDLNAAGNKLQLFVVRQVIKQIAEALMYLHAIPVIYRDLKSENILVWSLPTGKDAAPILPVLVKLADYGISRLVLPSGAKGFGGTPPFIAPEIIQRGGRDVYNTKVDIFSLGMFMYELITCRQPLREVHNPNVFVCQGGRPKIIEEESNLPVLLLDLMSICWSQDAKDRPSAAEVRQIVVSRQYCHLQEAVPLGNFTGILCAMSHLLSPHNLYEVSEDMGVDSECQVWMSTRVGNRPSLDILTYNCETKKCQDSKTVSGIENDVTAMTAVYDDIWCLDNNGSIHIYNANTFQETQTLELPSLSSKPQILNMYHVAEEQDVVIVCTNSTVIICKDKITGSTIDVKALEEDNFTCYCSVIVKCRQRYEIWLGINDGKVNVVNLRNLKENVTTLIHFDPPNANACCRFLETQFERDGETANVWSYNYPGTLLYKWDAGKQSKESKLDCSKVIPTVGNAASRSENFAAVHSQVTCLNVIGKYLYAATTWGCVMVADCLSMRPLIIFQCHGDKEFFIKSILPLNCVQDRTVFNARGSSMGIVTIGKGYCDLIKETVGRPDMISNQASSPVKEIEQIPQKDRFKNQTFALSWIADKWEYY